MTKLPTIIDQRVRYKLILKALPSPPAKVCEVGVGHGALLEYISQLGYEVCGCDISLESLPASSPVFSRVVQADGSKLPFSSKAFDVVYSCDVLEHVPLILRSAFLTEMCRIAKPGGVVAITAFYKNTLSMRIFGAATLVLRRTLPRWYREHLELPQPKLQETLDTVCECALDLKTHRYQRPLAILTMWFQVALESRPRLRWPFDVISYFVERVDAFGAPTSALVCFRKK